MAALISGADYLAIAQAYANARAQMLDTVQYFYDTVQTIVLMNDVVPTIDLVGAFYSAYLLNDARLRSTTGFEEGVRALQQHVARETADNDVAGFIEDEIVTPTLATGIPAEWAELSKIVGYDIDSVIES